MTCTYLIKRGLVETVVVTEIIVTTSGASITLSRESTDQRMVIGRTQDIQTVPSKLPWMLSQGVNSCSVVVFAPMFIKLVEWFPSTTNACFVSNTMHRLGRRETWNTLHTV